MLRPGQWTKGERVEGSTVAYRPLTRRGVIVEHSCEDCSGTISKRENCYLRSERYKGIFENTYHCLGCIDIRSELEFGMSIEDHCKKSELEAAS